MTTESIKEWATIIALTSIIFLIATAAQWLAICTTYQDAFQFKLYTAFDWFLQILWWCVSLFGGLKLAIDYQDKL